MSEFNIYAQRLYAIEKEIFNKYTEEDFEVLNKCRKIVDEHIGDGYEKIQELRKELEQEADNINDCERQLAIMAVFDKHIELFLDACFIPERVKNWDSFISEAIKNF